MTENVQIGNLEFALRRSAARRTIGITVERGGELTIRAPHDCPQETILRAAREKLLWTYGKLAEKKLLFTPPRPKKHIDGEGFYYLGESHRLMLIDDSTENAPLGLRGDWFWLRRDERGNAERHFERWYADAARGWIGKYLPDLAERIGVRPVSFEVRRLGFRWGACAPKYGAINFHWRVAQLPPEMIEYIIVHELVHLHEPRHSPEFWRRVARVIPDYRFRKQWLAENGSRL